MQPYDVEDDVKSDPENAGSWLMPFQRILVGIDLDGSAEDALNVALLIAKGSKSQLFLVNSEPAPPLNAHTMGDYSLQVRDVVMSAESQLRKILDQKLAVGEIPYLLHVSVGSPSDCLLAAAKEYDADLIVVGAHGRGGFEQLLFGSVSESLLRHSPCPVLIVGPGCFSPPEPVKTVLFCSDLEDTGPEAVRCAEGVSKIGSRHLVLMHVLANEPNVDATMRGWIEDGCKTKLLSLLTPESREKGEIDTCVSYGDPAQEILAAAHSQNANLLVLGAGEHAPLSDHLPWRTLAAIIRDASCPILNVTAGTA